MSEIKGRPFDARDRAFPALDDELLRALAWCALGSGAGYGRPKDDGAFYRALDLGLLRHDSVWQPTPQGEGVLIALGLMEPTWQKDRTTVAVLWAREPRENAPAHFVRAWPEGYREHWDESFAADAEEAKEWFRGFVDDEPLTFWTAAVEIARG